MCSRIAGGPRHANAPGRYVIIRKDFAPPKLQEQMLMDLGPLVFGTDGRFVANKPGGGADVWCAFGELVRWLRPKGATSHAPDATACQSEEGLSRCHISLLSRAPSDAPYDRTSDGYLQHGTHCHGLCG